MSPPITDDAIENVSMRWVMRRAVSGGARRKPKVTRGPAASTPNEMVTPHSTYSRVSQSVVALPNTMARSRSNDTSRNSFWNASSVTTTMPRTTAEERQALLGRGQQIALQQIDDLRLAPGVGGQEQDGERPGDRVHHADPRLDDLPAAPLQRRQRQDPAEREPGRAESGQYRIDVVAVRMGADHHAVDEQGERDAGRGQLRQGHAEKHHATQHEVDADQRAHDADEHAGDHARRAGGIPGRSTSTSVFMGRPARPAAGRSR